jgi:L-ascorbate metabolism protein UlaG (beta-lactamase superfamily)
MEITYYGHSCFLVNIGGFKVLFDPYITPNSKATNIDINTIEADYILLSHGHNDHIADLETIAKRTGATVIANYEISTWFEKKGLEKTVAMNIGGKVIMDFAIVKMVNAVHSSQLPDGSYGGSPAGFIIETGESTFYYSGDTALHQDMKLIPDMNKIDFAFMSIGDRYTMDVQDAIVAANFVDTKKIIGMHFDTWPDIEIDHETSVLLASSKMVELHLLDIGETIKM